MGTEPFIPAATQAEMLAAHPPGTRHAAMFKIAIPLLGNGMAPDAVVAQLRATFPDPDKTEEEMRGVVSWCIDRAPTPSGYGSGNGTNGHATTPRLALRPAAAPQPALPAPEKMKWWLNGQKTDCAALVASSPAQVPAIREAMPGVLFRALFGSEERINVLRQFTVNDKGKANPQGAGKSLTWAEWEIWIHEHGLPESEAGAWMRFNPTTEAPSGGGYADKDITAFRFMMIESDVLSFDDQLSFYHRCKLPIAAIVASGSGSSAHAWIRLDCPDDATYTATVARILKALEPFGFDKANKNPSRLTRLPGARRVIGAQGDGIQRLLYLNPQAKGITAEQMAEFEQRLRLPLVADLPFKESVMRGVDRYRDLHANRGKLGVPTGIEEFDKITGGLKDKSMIVIGAETGGGKTTLAVNILNHACWHHNLGVALFTLEMDRDEILDLLVSLNLSVDRNVFNHGNFSDSDFNKINAGAEKLAKLPLWVFDDPVMTVEQIKARTLQLKAEGLISLVVVDYLQIVAGSGEFRDNREQQVSQIARGLRALAKEAKVPLIALSQLNDEGKIRESRSIAHEAHIVLAIETADTGDLIAKVQKGRSIPKGDYFLKFERQFGRLTGKPMVRREEPERQYRQGHPNERRNR